MISGAPRANWRMGKVFLIKVSIFGGVENYLDIVRCVKEPRGSKKKMFAVIWTNHEECYDGMVGNNFDYNARNDNEEYEILKEIQEEDIEKVICLAKI